jgi:hypothetical protein
MEIDHQFGEYKIQKRIKLKDLHIFKNDEHILCLEISQCSSRRFITNGNDGIYIMTDHLKDDDNSNEMCIMYCKRKDKFLKIFFPKNYEYLNSENNKLYFIDDDDNILSLSFKDLEKYAYDLNEIEDDDPFNFTSEYLPNFISEDLFDSDVYDKQTKGDSLDVYDNSYDVYDYDGYSSLSDNNFYKVTLNIDNDPNYKCELSGDERSLYLSFKDKNLTIPLFSSAKIDYDVYVTPTDKLVVYYSMSHIPIIWDINKNCSALN